jgi:competence protein ComGF
MAFLKKYYSLSLKANSILESMIALTIISVCLYIAIMIFAAVFTPRTAAKFYDTQNKVNELFFLAQLKNDSLTYQNEDENLIIEEEIINDQLKKIIIQYKDSTKSQFDKSFYIQTNE